MASPPDESAALMADTSDSLSPPSATMVALAPDSDDAVQTPPPAPRSSSVRAVMARAAPIWLAGLVCYALLIGGIAALFQLRPAPRSAAVTSRFSEERSPSTHPLRFFLPCSIPLFFLHFPLLLIIA